MDIADNNMNICLVVVDSMRPDHLSCYGYSKKTSPNIDSIANGRLLFKNATAQSNWTYASLYSLISGRYPSVSKIGWFDQKINESFLTLPEALNEHGYKTAIFSSFRTLANKETFGKHFNDAKLLEIGEEALHSAQDWIKDNRRSFLLFHIGDYVHEPYYADKKFVDMFYEEDYEGLEFDDTLNSLVSLSMRDSGNKMRDINRALNLRTKRLTKKQLAYVIACYDAGIYYVDSFIGKLHEIFKKADNCLFIVTADHGQCFFEHGFYGHGLHLYDEVIRVPLVIDSKYKNRAVIDAPVQHIDIYPSLLELSGINGLAHDLDGDSFASVFSSGQLAADNRFAVSESFPFVSIRNKSHKLITTYFKAQRNKSILRELYLNYKDKNIRRFLFNTYAFLSADKLYDILNDPYEKRNIKGQSPKVYKMLFDKLKTILADTCQEGKDPVTVSMDNEVKRQLKNLGYM